MFESLSERLQNVVSNIKSKGIINEDNISDIVREIRLCLLEADVNVKIVKEFIANVKEKALGEAAWDITGYAGVARIDAHQPKQRHRPSVWGSALYYYRRDPHADGE